MSAKTTSISNYAFIKMPKLVLLCLMAIITVSTYVECVPVPDDNIEVNNVDDVKKLWDENKKHTFEGPDGNTYELSTRDIILIAAASILVLLILICCIGYCLCECMKNLICCLCCCRCD